MILQPQHKQADPSDPPSDARRTITLDEVEMDTTANLCPAPPAEPSGAYLTTDLFLQAMKENGDDIINSFNASIGALSRRIEDNSAMIATNAAAIKGQADQLVTQKSDLLMLTERVGRLERDEAKLTRNTITMKRTILSLDYLLARRSVRLWPIRGENENAWWEEVGDFLLDTLASGPMMWGRMILSQSPGPKVLACWEKREK